VYCCGLVETSENPVMTFPIKKRINTEMFINERPKLGGKLSGQFEEGKTYWPLDQQEVGTKNHNGSLFEMNYVRRKFKTITAACLK